MEEILSIAEIEAAKDVDYVVVSMPEWGGAIRLGSVSGEASFTFMEMIDKDPTARTDAVWNLVAQCMVDGEGNRLVKTDEDRRRVIATLKKKDIRATDRLIDATYRLLGLRTTRSPVPKNESGGEAHASSPMQLPEAVGV